MKVPLTYTWPYPKRVRNSNGSNPGSCNCCDKMVSWRSVANRCWRCEMDIIKTRRPLRLEREILMSLVGINEF